MDFWGWGRVLNWFAVLESNLDLRVRLIKCDFIQLDLSLRLVVYCNRVGNSLSTLEQKWLEP